MTCVRQLTSSRIETSNIEYRQSILLNFTMGSSNSVFTDKELSDYQELTYLSKKEILHVYKRFCQMGKDVTKYTKAQKDALLQLPELKVC